MWLVVPLSVWLVVVAQAQLYIFRCVHVSQLPQFKPVASDTVPEKSQVLIQVFKLTLCIAEWIFRILKMSILGRLLLCLYYSREREPSSVTLKPCTLPQWLLHPGFEPPLQFTSFPAGWLKFSASFHLTKKIWRMSVILAIKRKWMSQTHRHWDYFFKMIYTYFHGYYSYFLQLSEGEK